MNESTNDLTAPWNVDKLRRLGDDYLHTDTRSALWWAADELDALVSEIIELRSMAVTRGELTKAALDAAAKREAALTAERDARIKAHNEDITAAVTFRRERDEALAREAVLREAAWCVVGPNSAQGFTDALYRLAALLAEEASDGSN